METLGERVRRLRLERGFRAEVLAVALNVSAQTIHKLESGGGVRAERIAPLAAALGVSTDYLLGVSDTRHGTAGTADESEKAAPAPKRSRSRKAAPVG